MLTAEANLKSSQATYRRVVGTDPTNLRAGMPVDRLSPRTLDSAVDQGRKEHPTVQAAQYTVDAALHAVKAAEGSLYPTVTFESTVQRRWDMQPGVTDTMTGTVLGRVAVPIYQGGSEYSIIRQTKETLGQRRIELDVQRDQVRSLIVQAWSQLEATKAQIIAAQAQVTATEVALNGVREEARVGQRTTLDVLNAQQELVNARVSLVTAQRDRVVASFTLLSSVGRLSPQQLRLATDLMIRACTIIRCATSGSACARRTAARPTRRSTFGRFLSTRLCSGCDLPHAIFARILAYLRVCPG